jgi:hypothetical protein
VASTSWNGAARNDSGAQKPYLTCGRTSCTYTTMDPDQLFKRLIGLYRVGKYGFIFVGISGIYPENLKLGAIQNNLFIRSALSQCGL